MIGLVRNKAAADANLKEQGVSGVTMVEADYGSLDSLKVVPSLQGNSLMERMLTVDRGRLKK